LRVIGNTMHGGLSVTGLPEHPNLDHLKKQAKNLLRLYQAGDATAFARLRNSLPTAHGKDDAAIVALGLKLHDMQSCIAREYGLPSWRSLRDYVEWTNAGISQSRKETVPLWLHDIYGHMDDRSRPVLAARKLAARPDLGRGELFLACATGDEAAIRAAIAADPACVNVTANNWPCPCGKELLDMPPLVAVTHSGLLRLLEFQDRLRRCARILLDAGADPNQSWTHSSGYSLSALYGAAGKNHDVELTRMLLDAGANPNDNESLYHSTENRDLTCMRLLLQAGATVEGTNAVHHILDRNELDGLKLLLAYVKDFKALTSTIGDPLIWAIRRRRPRAHVEALLSAGADPNAKTSHGISAHRFALQNGLPEIAEALARAGAGPATEEPLSIEDQFVAACARADRREAERILALRPDIFKSLSTLQLRQLPQLMESRATNAVKLMVNLGWPIAAQGGDWSASALNLAVFQGDADMTRFLLEHGAAWTELHGFNDNVRGTLSWASRNNDPENGDWVGCAEALVDHGMPVDLEGNYSDEVAEFFAAHSSKT
jgi:ankyrin repeat protein